MGEGGEDEDGGAYEDRGGGIILGLICFERRLGGSLVIIIRWRLVVCSVLRLEKLRRGWCWGSRDLGRLYGRLWLDCF